MTLRCVWKLYVLKLGLLKHDVRETKAGQFYLPPENLINS